LIWWCDATLLPLSKRKCATVMAVP
jgi:hypothetical protein